ncbi:hypothetical protein A3L11_03915 [Thermococcus siculi]|uniref:Uncharacterized protein n=1 Tax=Thermococcus siculi TaxID=72803 RepID=A0A2Z2MW66_9EURY|nr:hypothetical protein [Thermococcus siculi]ASJ08423.1 hypothetical protein A3L11_03915 [Thermococcus siculi]
MKRGQISLDFLFAITLIAITVLNIVYIANMQRSHAETFDATTRLKIFSVDMRDTVAKVYASGNGFSVKKEPPIPLDSGDSITIQLITGNNTIIITANVGGRQYVTVQRSPVPIYQNESIQMTPDNSEIWVKARERGGKVYVELSYSP